MVAKKVFSTVIKRYTTLSSALDTLTHGHLTFLNTEKWDDTNDAYFIDLYRKIEGAGSAVAICCTMAAETYHHWRVFTTGMEGACLEFKRVPLQTALKPPATSRGGAVRYVTLAELNGEEFTLRDLPMLKRYGYRDEREWRSLLLLPNENVRAHNIPIPLSTLKRVILNPWLPPPLFNTIKATIHAIPGCEHIKVVPSSLISNSRWKAEGDRLAAKAK